MNRRWGAVTVAELLLVFWLSGPLALAAATFARTQTRAAERQGATIRAQDLERTARIILDRELRHALPAQMVDGGGDSLALRAARGSGTICGRFEDRLAVRYSGVRAPDPSKDSVLLIAAAGIEAARILETAESALCDSALDLRLDRPADTRAGMLLVFERGTYSAASGALRYRRGNGGRQPLTDALLGGSAVLHSSRAGVDLVLEFGNMPAHPTPAPVTARIHSLNGLEELR